jgi:hypothetical protein
MDRLHEVLGSNITLLRSDDATLLRSADVVVFNLPRLPYRIEDYAAMRAEREPWQVWVAWCLESEVNYPWVFSPQVRELFDVYMTYRQDSDVVLPYYSYRHAQTLLSLPQPKTKGVCMFIAKPADQRKRCEYLRELMQYIRIDSYGSFERNSTLPNDLGYRSKIQAMRSYKFTVAFENSECADYVTEKLYDPLIAGAVPVYLGAPNVEEFAPSPRSYINAVEYSPRELADKISSLLNNEADYGEYLQWKNEPIGESLQRKIEVQKIHPFQRLHDYITGGAYSNGDVRTPPFSNSFPLISVIIPAYNAASTIRATVESVLSQTYSPVEVLVVDDGSTDETEEIVANLRANLQASGGTAPVRYFKLPHKNANVARNYGLQQCTGMFAAFLDADDVWLPPHLEQCLQAIRQQKSDGIYGSLMVDGKTITVRSLRAGETMLSYLLQTGCGAQTSTLFTTTESAKSVGWDEELNRHQDYDFAVRYAKKYKFAPKLTATVIYNTSHPRAVKIDFASCIKFIERNRDEISPELYGRYSKNMLRVALAQGADVGIVEHYRQALSTDRSLWLATLCKMATPVLTAMSQNRLKLDMPVEYSPTWDGRSKKVAYLEALGRAVSGVAPWLNSSCDASESTLYAQLRERCMLALANAVNPRAPDYLEWAGEPQALVDAAYLANGFLRAPALWSDLDSTTQERYVKEFAGLRRVEPFNSNWLLFRAMLETFLLSTGHKFDKDMLTFIISRINSWYVGDGWYSDGDSFAFDYYNSFVIHPMLVEILDVCKSRGLAMPLTLDVALRRMQRYNELLERMVSPDGTFPLIGRSITYRTGIFQPLALAAWKYSLPPTLKLGQVRSMLTRVIQRLFGSENCYTQQGFLQLGFTGRQPHVADYYTNTGSLYMATLVFLPLGLPPDHEFWTSKAEPWTQQKAWNGEDFRRDCKIR